MRRIFLVSAAVWLACSTGEDTAIIPSAAPRASSMSYDSPSSRALPHYPTPRCMSVAACEEWARTSARKDVDPACAEECVTKGRCVLQKSQCVPRDSNDCTFSLVCLRMGLCEAKPGLCGVAQGDECFHCRVGSTDTCRRSLGCRELGQCTAALPTDDLPWGECVVGDDDDCRQSVACSASGECTMKHAACVAASDSDCAGSSDCIYHRRCRHDGDSCVL